MTDPAPPAPTRPPPARVVRAARVAAPWAIPVVGVLLAWYGQISLRVTGAGRLAVGAVVVVVGVVAAAQLVGLRWWRSRPVLAWLAFWLALAASAALTWRSLPVGEDRLLGEVRALVTAREEVTLLAASAAAGTALLLLARGTRAGARGFRALWLAVLATTAPVAVWEIITDRHIVVTRWIDWYFTAHTPAATFANPNNYACVLVAVVGTLLAWSLDRVPRWAAVGLVALAAGTAGLIWATLSRGAFAAVAVQVLIWGIGLLARGDVASRLRASRAARLIAGAGALLVAAAVLASFLVPALAARNPLLRAPKAGEEASDDVRVNLVLAGLRYWRSAPWVGTGPGTYEYHLTKERPPGVPDPTTNAHNGFVEILSQYGLLAAVPFAALLALLTWYVVRRGHSTRVDAPALDPAAIAHRVELANLLVAFVVTALVVSSAPGLPLWFVMLAHATALAWAADRARGADDHSSAHHPPGRPIAPA